MYIDSNITMGKIFMKTNAKDSYTQLSELIKINLKPLISNSYIYLDLPYHSNIGDILIWRGTEDFLKELHSKCIGRHSKETFDFRDLPKNCTILLHGGGNLGDLWRPHQDFRLKVIQQYVNNHIIILPQTVHYESEDTFSEDIKIMNKHKFLTICARDAHSANLLNEKGFTGNLLMLPDMAFCINPNTFTDKSFVMSHKNLFLLREDKEQKISTLKKILTDTTFSDWPNMQDNKAKVSEFLMTHNNKEVDRYFQEEYFPLRIKEGVELALSYKETFSTRLHFAILRLLLGLPVKITDSSYGKCLNFYNTWLKDSELVSVSEKEEQDIFDLANYIRKQDQQFRDLTMKLKERLVLCEESITQLQKYKKIVNASLIVSLLLFLSVILVIFIYK